MPPETSSNAIDINALLSQAGKATELLKAISNKKRLLILCLLSDGEKSVSELEKTMEMPQASVSQQLARLRMDELVTSRRDGRTIYYTISSPEARIIVGQLYELFCKPASSQ